MLSFTISINLHKLYIKIIIKERLSCQLNHGKNAISILFFVCLTINGQQIKQSSNHYHNGDILEKKHTGERCVIHIFLMIPALIPFSLDNCRMLECTVFPLCIPLSCLQKRCLTPPKRCQKTAQKPSENLRNAP